MEPNLPIDSNAIVKIIGGICGTIISITSMKKISLLSIISRTFIGIISAYIFSDIIIELITNEKEKASQHEERSLNILLAISTLMSFTSWHIFNIASRTMEKWQTINDIVSDFKQIKNGNKINKK